MQHFQSSPDLKNSADLWPEELKNNIQVLYIYKSSSFWLLGVGLRDFSQAK